MFCIVFFQSFNELQHKPLLVDLTVEEGSRLKVIYGSTEGFHAVDVDAGNAYDIYLSSHEQVNCDTYSGWLSWYLSLFRSGMVIIIWVYRFRCQLLPMP